MDLAICHTRVTTNYTIFKLLIFSKLYPTKESYAFPVYKMLKNSSVYSNPKKQAKRDLFFNKN